jgi:hypothetical protein
MASSERKSGGSEGRAIENRRSNVDEVNRVQHLLDSLEDTLVGCAAGCPAAFERGQGRGDQAITSGQIGLERGGFGFADDQLQQCRGIDVGDAGHLHTLVAHSSSNSLSGRSSFTLRGRGRSRRDATVPPRARRRPSSVLAVPGSGRRIATAAPCSVTVSASPFLTRSR